MNNLTISQAMIKLSEVEKAYRTKLGEISRGSSTTVCYIEEADGVRHNCGDRYNFEKEKETLMDLSSQMETLKHAISKANNSTFVEIDGKRYTIQECLNKLQIYRKELSTFEAILLHNKPSKIRKVDAAGTSAYYLVTELTYDKENLQDFVNELSQTVLNLELALNEANNNTVITIA